MEYRQLGGSGLRVPVLTLGTATFGGKGSFFQAVGNTDIPQATELVSICLDAGLNMFDTADIYSAGASEEILGAAVKGRRDKVLISGKSANRMGKGPNDVGASAYHLTRGIEASLKRLGTDYIDLFQLHSFDALTPIHETLSTLDNLVKAGKIRYLGCSNYSGWHLMKSLAIADARGYSRFVAHQAYYSLISREYEWELMPLGLDQKVGAVVWSPLASGRLTGKLRRGQPAPEGSRLAVSAITCPQGPIDRLYNIVDVLDELARETGKNIPQIALNWLLQRPTVSTLVIGARNPQQLKDNLGATGWALSADQVSRLDSASKADPIYPYWYQAGSPERSDHIIWK
jgi:aryl-alcohol dehydrogenase-like predicted oxidoreductase